MYGVIMERIMKTTSIVHIIVFGVLAACTSCNTTHSSIWEEMPVVAHVETLDGEPLTVCHLDQLKDTVHIPLSELVEDLHIVKLDNREEAMVNIADISLSENYILVAGFRSPCKLFRKDGTYVGKIGEYGTAVGEYKDVYDAQIDEKNGRIYLLPWYGRGILVYRFDGTFEKAIPLHAKYPRLYAPKGIFQVDAENNRIAVVSLPFKNLPHVAWVQDMEGNRMQEIPIAHLKLEPNSSNEVRGSKATDALSFHISPFFELRQDSLYHWDMQQQKLIPRFTIDFGEKPIPLHVYYELPLYYFAEISGTKQMTEDSYVSDRETYFLVDKATLRGSFCHIYNDYLCDEPSDWVIGRNGYFIENVAPDVLKERIETFLQASPDLNEARRQRLLALKDSISENDNNYIIYGKHRTRK